jgi:hypothetical protein
MSEGKHPYSKFEDTELWSVIEKTLNELEQNQDIQITTGKEYVIGFLGQGLSDHGVSIEPDPKNDLP